VGLQWKILIACSDRAWAQTLCDILGAWGAQVICTDTIREAKTILGEQAMSVVFCEQNLADGSFHVLLGTLASRTPPVRLVAMVHDAEEHCEALRSGAFDAIPIPCRRSEVQWMVVNALRDAVSPFDYEKPSASVKPPANESFRP
jgi:DNA-binding NtrC family response regulator